jgi:hypothetical protein
MRSITISCGGGDLTVDDVDLDLTLPFAIHGSACSVTIRNSIVRQGVVQVTGGKLTVDRSTFFSGSGIKFSNTDQLLLVLNSVFTPGPQSAITINNGGDTTSRGGALILNNTFAGRNLDCNGGSDSKIFESNIFSNALGLEDEPHCFYRYNLIEPFQAVSGTGNIAGNPSFVDAVHNDFHLAAGSPAIDAAPASSEPNGHDRDGRPRPRGPHSDIGAFEYAP